jgi:hypothetical protein
VAGRSNRRATRSASLAHTRLDVNRTVRARLDVRSVFASAEGTRALTGMEIGGVTVFGLPADLPIWIDARVMARERISAAATERQRRGDGHPPATAGSGRGGRIGGRAGFAASAVRTLATVAGGFS